MRRKPRSLSYSPLYMQGLNCLDPKCRVVSNIFVTSRSSYSPKGIRQRPTSNLMSNCTLGFSWGPLGPKTFCSNYFCFLFFFAGNFRTYILFLFFTDSLDWAGYDEKSKGKLHTNCWNKILQRVPTGLFRRYMFRAAGKDMYVQISSVQLILYILTSFYKMFR